MEQVNINVTKVEQDVTINATPNVTQIIVTTQNGGTQNLNDVLSEGNETDGENIFISDGDEITFDNGSRIRKGLTDAGNGGAQGVALVCSLDYELKWEAGRQYVMQQDGFTIREVSHNFTITPSATDDSTKGFAIDSRWILDNGDVYVCTDATEDSAVWELQVTDVQDLQNVTDIGNTTTNPILIPELQLYDSATDAYAKISYSDGQFDFRDINGRIIKVIEKDGLEQTLNLNDFTLTKEISSLTANRQRTEPDKNGTYAMLDDIPTNTSQLVNDGEDGTSPFVTVDQLPSNLNLFATNTSSDIATYFKLVTSIDDPDYNTTPVDIPTGAITTTGQFIAALSSEAGVLIGNPGIINLLTIGNVRRTSGTGTAEFYYEVYHRTSAGTETLISTSSKTAPVNTNVYTEFLAAALLNNGTFLVTDRIVVKYYADRIGGGSNPSYQFQFGGTSPVRTTFPVPASNLPFLLTTLSDVVISGATGGDILAYNDILDVWENKSIPTVLGYTPLPTNAGTATGATLSFITDRIYGTIASPVTGNITADVTGAQLGVTNIIIHNSGTAPTFSSEYKKLSGSGNYIVSVVNYIYCTFITSTEIIYSINQRT
jgi:hypothetical protein